MDRQLYSININISFCLTGDTEIITQNEDFNKIIHNITEALTQVQDINDYYIDFESLECEE